MRDLIIASLIFGTFPFILKSPFIGILVWCWVGIMNPHRLCWGFAVNFKFALMVAILTLFSLYRSNENKKIPWRAETKILLVFVAWMFCTTCFAFNSAGAWEQWGKVWKIMLMTYVTLMVIKSPERLQALIWVIVLSLGFYGIKGGIFTISTGGSHLVLGPGNSFIADRGPIAMALCMNVPLMRYLQLQAKEFWLRWGLITAMILTGFAIIGTHSRGGFLSAVCMSSMLLLKSRKKIFLLLFLALSAYAILNFMPSTWGERMQTINTYEQDGSAMGRINAWYFAYNLAMDNFFGGGFECFRGWLFDRYAPEPNNVHDAHNVFFEVLGEHGFIGLFLFVLLIFTTWRSAKKMLKQCKKIPGAIWLSDLAAMIHVSLIAYFISGFFIGMAYFDLLYYIFAIIIVSQEILEKNQTGEARELEIPEVNPLKLFRNILYKTL